MIKIHWKTMEKYDDRTHKYLVDGSYISRYYAEKNRRPHTKIVAGPYGWSIIDKNDYELAIEKKRNEKIKKTKWIDIKGGMKYQCPRCNGEVFYRTKYCPNCGKKM